MGLLNLLPVNTRPTWPPIIREIEASGVTSKLKIAKSLVDLHDDKLVIKSKVGKGTTVTLKLPDEAP